MKNAAYIAPKAEALADAFGEALRDMLIRTHHRIRAAALPGDRCAEVLASVCAAHLVGYLKNFGTGTGPEARQLLDNVIAASFDAGEEIAAAKPPGRPS